MKRAIVVLLLSAAGAYAFSTAQINVPTTAGTVTFYAPGNDRVSQYIGNGQPSVWEGSTAEFCNVMERGAALCKALR